MSQKTFVNYTREKPPKRHGCVICNEPTAGHVQLALREKTTERTKSGTPRGIGRQIDSRMVSLCEPHAIEVFEHALEAFPSRSAGGPR